jgi:DNA-directed RNA polymerase specialized sigma24 family protein
MGTAPTPGSILTRYAHIIIRTKAKQLCQHRGFSRCDEEDLVQELTLRLLQKEHLYDPARGASLETFADRVLDSAAKLILRERRRHKRAAGFHTRSLSTEVIQDRKPVLLGQVVSDADRHRARCIEARRSDPISDDDLTIVLRSLPPVLADIALRLQTGTTTSVARDLGVSRRSIDRAILRIRRYFEAAGFGSSGKITDS